MPSIPSRQTVLGLGALTAILGVAAIAWVTMRQTGPGSLLPHGYCFTWNPALVWTHVFSDLLIGLSYLTIPLTLLHLVRKRGDMPFNGIVLLFATFIVSCGATHLIGVWTIWNPDYYLAGSVKVITAGASLLTAGALIRLVPQVLAIPTVSQMSAANAALAREVQQRRLAEDELRQERAALEVRVHERTQALEQANTEALEARQAAEEANLQKDRFLAKVSHELRTPLQSMLSWAEVLGHNQLDPQRAKQAAERIAHNVQLQARLIDDLLDISRILHGKLSLQLQSTELLPLLGRVVDMQQAPAVQRGVTIVVESAAATPAAGDMPTQPTLLTDPTRLEQIIWNLLSNAVRASRPGGTVRLSWTTQPEALLLSITDDGEGIAADLLPLLFEPFYQRGAAAGRHAGLGLGLAIVRQLVSLLGGDVKAFSAGLGHGAEFQVRLPLHRSGEQHTGLDTPDALAAHTAHVAHPTSAGETATTEPLSGDEVARLKGVRVVFVEDQEDIARSGALALVALGLQVALCQRYDEAVVRLAAGDFDLLLTDFNLDDGHTGPELLQALRRLPHGEGVPALVLSAYGREEDKQASTAAGFAEHLVKPLDSRQLVRALLAALRGGT